MNIIREYFVELLLALVIKLTPKTRSGDILMVSLLDYYKEVNKEDLLKIQNKHAKDMDDP